MWVRAECGFAGGGMGRIAGATFIFLFAPLLAHIPILLIRVGVPLLAASAKLQLPSAP